MNDNAFDNVNATNENADNLSQNQDEMVNNAFNDDTNESFEEALSNETENETVSKLKAELDEAKDKYVRLVAEFDNFRRRSAKEKIENIQTAGKDIMHSLLVILDDSQRAIVQMEKSNDFDALKEGISLVFNKLHNTLQSKGLKVMDSLNQPFDPDLHEALTEVPAPTPDMVGKIIDVIEPGYYLNDKLIRHAKVVVGK